MDYKLDRFRFNNLVGWIIKLFSLYKLRSKNMKFKKTLTPPKGYKFTKADLSKMFEGVIIIEYAKRSLQKNKKTRRMET